MIQILMIMCDFPVNGNVNRKSCSNFYSCKAGAIGMKDRTIKKSWKKTKEYKEAAIELACVGYCGEIWS
jgi:hypothetical protein